MPPSRCEARSPAANPGGAICEHYGCVLGVGDGASLPRLAHLDAEISGFVLGDPASRGDLFKASRYLQELDAFRPDIAAACAKAMGSVSTDLDFIRIDVDAFTECVNESIDYVVMEKISDAVVVPMDAGWSDIVSWS